MFSHPKLFSNPTFFLLKICLDPKNFSDLDFFDYSFFWTRNFLWPKIFLDPKKIWSKIFLGPKFQFLKNFTQKCFWHFNPSLAKIYSSWTLKTLSHAGILKKEKHLQIIFFSRILKVYMHCSLVFSKITLSCELVAAMSARKFHSFMH